MAAGEGVSMAKRAVAKYVMDQVIRPRVSAFFFSHS